MSPDTQEFPFHTQTLYTNNKSNKRQQLWKEINNEKNIYILHGMARLHRISTPKTIVFILVRKSLLSLFWMDVKFHFVLSSFNRSICGRRCEPTTVLLMKLCVGRERERNPFLNIERERRYFLCVKSGVWGDKCLRYFPYKISNVILSPLVKILMNVTFDGPRCTTRGLYPNLRIFFI